MSRTYTSLCALFLVAALSGACANTVKGAQKDTEKAVEKTAAATNTVDVKSALIAERKKSADDPEYLATVVGLLEKQLPRSSAATTRTLTKQPKHYSVPAYVSNTLVCLWGRGLGHFSLPKNA